MAPPPGVSRVPSHPLSPHCAVHRMPEAFTGHKDSNCLLPSVSLWGKAFLGRVWVWGVVSPSAQCYSVTLLQCYSIVLA